MAKIIIETAGADGRDFQLEPGVFTAGVASDRDIVVDAAPLVSDNHASLRFENNRWFVRDEGSIFGTYVNNRRVKEQGLQDGDVVELGLGGPILRFEAERAERERSAATTAGHLKQLLEQHADDLEPEPEPLEGAGEIALPVATRGVLLALGGVALVALGALWVTSRGTDPEMAGTPATASPVAPGGALYPLQTASRGYLADGDRVTAEADRLRDGGVRRTRLQEDLAGVVAGIESGASGAVLDSLQARRGSLESRLADFEEMGRIGRAAAASVVLIQTGFQVDSFYFPGPTGTGIVVGEGGRVVTNRHVVAPTTYIRSSDEAGLACALEALAARGMTATRVISVWAPGSTPGRRPDGGLDPATATHSTTAGTVEVAGLLGGDVAEPRLIGCPEGGVVETQHQDGRVGDLALLSVTGGNFAPLAMADAVPANGDLVILTGFPRGTAAGTSEPWLTFAPVMSSGESIVFGAPVLPGSDGGALLDRTGRLVGVATASRDDEGMAVGLRHVRALLDGA